MVVLGSAVSDAPELAWEFVSWSLLPVIGPKMSFSRRALCFGFTFLLNEKRSSSEVSFSSVLSLLAPEIGPVLGITGAVSTRRKFFSVGDEESEADGDGLEVFEVQSEANGLAADAVVVEAAVSVLLVECTVADAVSVIFVGLLSAVSVSPVLVVVPVVVLVVVLAIALAIVLAIVLVIVLYIPLVVPFAVVGAVLEVLPFVAPSLRIAFSSVVGASMADCFGGDVPTKSLGDTVEGVVAGPLLVRVTVSPLGSEGVDPRAV